MEEGFTPRAMLAMTTHIRESCAGMDQQVALRGAAPDRCGGAASRVRGRHPRWCCARVSLVVPRRHFGSRPLTTHALGGFIGSEAPARGWRHWEESAKTGASARAGGGVVALGGVAYGKPTEVPVVARGPCELGVCVRNHRRAGGGGACGGRLRRGVGEQEVARAKLARSSSCPSACASSRRWCAFVHVTLSAARDLEPAVVCSAARSPRCGCHHFDTRGRHVEDGCGSTWLPHRGGGPRSAKHNRGSFHPAPPQIIPGSFLRLRWVGRACSRRQHTWVRSVDSSCEFPDDQVRWPRSHVRLSSRVASDSHASPLPARMRRTPVPDERYGRFR